jgi:hypothetical protein
MDVVKDFVGMMGFIVEETSGCNCRDTDCSNAKPDYYFLETHFDDFEDCLAMGKDEMETFIFCVYK